MFQSIKKANEIKQKIKQRDMTLFGKNNDGELVYELKLGKGEIYSNFATKNNPIINENLVTHIDDVCDCLSVKDNVEIRILTPKDNSANKRNIEEALNNHYTKKLIQSKRQYKRQVKQGIFMFVVGLLVFGLYFLLRSLFDIHNNISAFEIIDIISWVFIWEAVDLIFLGIIEHKNEEMRFSKIAHAKITIITESNKKININIDEQIDHNVGKYESELDKTQKAKSTKK